MADKTFPPLNISPHWQSVQDTLLQIIDLLPEEKLNFTPRADLWNSKGILIHISDARDQWLTRDVQDGEPYLNVWTRVKTKADLRSELERSFARLQRFLSNQAQLDTKHESEHRDQFDGHWIAFHLLEHDIHHRAELLQRLALLDIPHDIDF
jgi:uncharacterized damage-inducible protein DinB